MKELTAKSKYLEHLLCHSSLPDYSGWVDISDLEHPYKYTKEELNEIVARDEKGLYEFSDNNIKIRAKYGHSNRVLIEPIEVAPPDWLYYGTTPPHLELIRKNGIWYGEYGYVPLFLNKGVAMVHGKKFGKSVVLTVNSAAMHRAGFKFYQAPNGLWYTKHVESRYVDADTMIKSERIYTERNAEQYVINGHEAVDLGLSVKWATYNVGASELYESGGLFAWGEILPRFSQYYMSRGCRLYNAVKGCFDIDVIEEHYPQGVISKRYEMNGKECSQIDYCISGSEDFDAARAHWGAGWRLPRIKEFEELVNKCVWERINPFDKRDPWEQDFWPEDDDLNGYKVIGPNGNSIFLPFTIHTSLDLYGTYCSGDISLYRNSYRDVAINSYVRFDHPYRPCLETRILDGYGFSIRPVTDL